MGLHCSLFLQLPVEEFSLNIGPISKIVVPISHLDVKWWENKFLLKNTNFLLTQCPLSGIFQNFQSQFQVLVITISPKYVLNIRREILEWCMTLLYYEV